MKLGNDNLLIHRWHGAFQQNLPTLLSYPSWCYHTLYLFISCTPSNAVFIHVPCPSFSICCIYILYPSHTLPSHAVFTHIEYVPYTHQYILYLYMYHVPLSLYTVFIHILYPPYTLPSNAVFTKILYSWWSVCCIYTDPHYTLTKCCT